MSPVQTARGSTALAATASGSLAWEIRCSGISRLKCWGSGAQNAWSSPQHPLRDVCRALGQLLRPRYERLRLVGERCGARAVPRAQPHGTFKWLFNAISAVHSLTE